LNSHRSYPILPTLASFVGAQITGFCWYGPLFGKKWMAAMKERKPDFAIDDGQLSWRLVFG